MKKILIYDVAAEKTGAATVLKRYYDKYSSDETVETYIVNLVVLCTFIIISNLTFVFLVAIHQPIVAEYKLDRLEKEINT